MDSMETVLDTGLGDVESDAMSPLATPGNEVSELEQEAVALSVASHIEQDDDEEDVTGTEKSHYGCNCKYNAGCVVFEMNEIKIVIYSLMKYTGMRFESQKFLALYILHYGVLRIRTEFYSLSDYVMPWEFCKFIIYFMFEKVLGF